MRKKYIVINTLILVFSLLIFLFTSACIVSDLNLSNRNETLKNYLSLIESSFDGTNMEAISSKIQKTNKNLRITFIDKDGNVLLDTDKTSEENHLDRYEIKNIGKMACRYSETTNIKMYYLASYDSTNGIYIRVAIPESSVSDTVNSFAYYGFAAIIILSFISFGFIYLSSKKLVKPLKNEISNLSKITNTELSYRGDDLVELSNQIVSVSRIINNYIASIKSETDKLNYIIENMNNGIIIISGLGNILLINNVALKVLNRKKEDIQNKSYLYCFVDLKIANDIEKAMNSKQEYSTIYENDDRTYLVSITSLYADFVMDGEQSGVSVFIYDITEEKRLEKVKLDFFANASHELKSPLTSIIGYQQMISEGIISDEAEIKEATAKTIKEATRMNQIIIDMLELSKLEMVPSRLKKDSLLSMSESVDSTLESFDEIIKQKQIKIIKDYCDFQVLFDKEDLYHLIRNIVDNAIKYNVLNGVILIKIDASNRTLAINNTGEIISNEDQIRIFERFYRVDKAKSKELGGTGLGLAIVKHICLNNDVLINVESKANEGTTFTFKFK